MHVNRHTEQEKQGGQSDQSFSQVLETAKEQSEKAKEVRKEDKLRMMGGLNQYNWQAVEFCFMLSSETDFKA